MLFVDNTANKQGGPLPGLLGKHSLWPWAQAWLFASTIFVHLLQPQGAVREEADCCLLTTFWLELHSSPGAAVGQSQDTDGDSFVSQMGKLRPENVKIVLDTQDCHVSQARVPSTKVSLSSILLPLLSSTPTLEPYLLQG